jgi:FMN hydrolase / 5-amino-6-(5-phospho-D-ribitylamino)uracil phosphatase
LWDVEPVIARAEERLMQWLRQHCPRIPERLSLADMRIARQQLAAREPHRAHDFTYLRIATLASHARECGYSEEIAHQAFKIFFEARNQLDLFADVRPGLTRLRACYTLATLSNGNADLGLIGLSDFFTVSLNARGVGAAKPDRRAFEQLVQALNLTAGEVLYVGDDPLLDVEAAREAGLQAAWMNRSGLTWPANVSSADVNVIDCIDLAIRLGA